MVARQWECGNRLFRLFKCAARARIRFRVPPGAFQGLHHGMVASGMFVIVYFGCNKLHFSLLQSKHTREINQMYKTARCVKSIHFGA